MRFPRALPIALLLCSPALGQSLPPQIAFPVTPNDATNKDYVDTTTVRVSPAAQISLGRTWLGQPTYPVPGLALIPAGHLAIQGATRGWGAGASILEVFANDPAGGTFCGGAMSCYVQPNNRGYAGQDGVAATFIANSRAPLAQGLAVSGIASVTMGNGAPAVRITLAAPLSPAQIAAVVPLMKVETTAGTAGFFGYTVATGLAYPPVSPDGLTLTVDGMFNTAGQAMPTPAAGTQIALDVLHQVDGLYIGTHITDGDGIRDTHAIEGVMVNNRSTPTVFSAYDPLTDVPDVNGIYMPITGDVTGGLGLGGSAFLAADTLGAGAPGTWKRGFACRNRPTANSGVTDCVTNAFAVNGLHSVATTTNGALTNNALLVQPNDLSGATTALITQAGDAVFHSVTSAGPMQITGQSNLTNLNANLTAFSRASLPATGCAPGNIVFVPDGRNVPLDGASGPVSGVPAFCNAAHQWIAMTTGLPVAN